MITEIADHQTSPQPAITVYTKPACQQCKAVFRWLDKHELTYTAVDVTQDDDALTYVKQLGYEAAPVTVTSDGAHFYGYDPGQLGALL